jgi:3-hydroxybutyryl-CoA dehydrogenase
LTVSRDGSAWASTSYDIEEHYAAENPHLPPAAELLRHYIDAGKLGAKTGEGFYADYPRSRPQN